LNVAIIEDNQLITELLNAPLRANGHVAVPIRPQREAVLKATWDEIDVALVDLFLEPDGITGPQVLTLLRDRAPHVRRVLITASAGSPEEVPTELRALAHSTFIKPFDLKALLKEVSHGRAHA
jgi:DNA-binding NtrC family response regulator